MRLLRSSSSSSKEQYNGDKNRALLYLNVYDLTPVNNYLYWAGLGVFHSGIEVHGLEYGYGAHDYSTSGVFEVEPRSCPGFIFRRSVLLGSTDMSHSEVRSFMEHISEKYHGDSYHLIAKNCNHFADEVCLRLTGKPIPGWVNRLARVGSFCNCILPESIQVTRIRHLPDHQAFSGVNFSALESVNEGLKCLVPKVKPSRLIQPQLDMTKIAQSHQLKDGTDSGASSVTVDSEEEHSDHQLLTVQNSEMAFLNEKPVRLAKELL